MVGFIPSDNSLLPIYKFNPPLVEISTNSFATT